MQFLYLQLKSLMQDAESGIAGLGLVICCIEHASAKLLLHGFPALTSAHVCLCWCSANILQVAATSAVTAT
jgi:hypothetical protein